MKETVRLRDASVLQTGSIRPSNDSVAPTGGFQLVPVATSAARLSRNAARDAQGHALSRVASGGRFMVTHGFAAASLHFNWWFSACPSVATSAALDGLPPEKAETWIRVET